MDQILALLMLLGDIKGGMTGRRSTYQIGMAVALMSVTLICEAGAIGCTATAIWIFSAPAIGPGGAALVTAGALLVPCLIVLIACRPAPAARTQVAQAAGELDLINVAASEALRLVRDHKVPMLLAAFLAGLAASEGKGDR
jgi:hypothetical protein